MLQSGEPAHVDGYVWKDGKISSEGKHVRENLRISIQENTERSGCSETTEISLLLFLFFLLNRSHADTMKGTIPHGEA